MKVFDEESTYNLCENCLYDKMPLNGHMCAGCLDPKADINDRKFTSYPIPLEELT